MQFIQRMLTNSPTSEVYASVQVWADSKPLTTPVRTSYKSFKSSGRRLNPFQNDRFVDC